MTVRCLMDKWWKHVYGGGKRVFVDGKGGWWMRTVVKECLSMEREVGG
jgi:hypothetical protein